MSGHKKSRLDTIGYQLRRLIVFPSRADEWFELIRNDPDLEISEIVDFLRKAPVKGESDHKDYRFLQQVLTMRLIELVLEKTDCGYVVGLLLEKNIRMLLGDLLHSDSLPGTLHDKFEELPLRKQVELAIFR